MHLLKEKKNLTEEKKRRSKYVIKLRMRTNM